MLCVGAKCRKTEVPEIEDIGPKKAPKSEVPTTMQGIGIYCGRSRGCALLVEVLAFLQLLVQLPLRRVLQDEVHPRLHSGASGFRGMPLEI